MSYATKQFPNTSKDEEISHLGVGSTNDKVAIGENEGSVGDSGHTGTAAAMVGNGGNEGKLSTHLS